MSLNLPLKSVLGPPKPSLGLTPGLPPSDTWPTRPDAFNAHHQHCWQLPGTQWTVLGRPYGTRFRCRDLACATRMLQTLEQSPHILALLVVLSKDKIHGGTVRQSLLSKVIQVIHTIGEAGLELRNLTFQNTLLGTHTRSIKTGKALSISSQALLLDYSLRPTI